MSYFDDLRVIDAGIYPRFHGCVPPRSPKHYSLELVASGRMYFQRHPDGQAIIDYPALRWQSPDYTYSYGAVDDNGWEHYFVLFEGSRAERLYHTGFEPLVDHGCLMRIRRVDLFRKLFITVHDHVTHAGLNQDLAAFYIEELLVRASEDLQEPVAFTKYLRDFEQLVAELRTDLGKTVDFREIATGMGLSYSYFRKLFSEFSGIPPHQYLLRARLIAAAERLRTTDEPIKKIGDDLGLGNPAQFSKTFRATYNMPPGTYRQCAGAY